MPQTVIENLIFNSPFSEPSRHFKFSEEGITDEIIGERRNSAYFIPIAQPAWSALYSTRSRPFDTPKTGRIAVKVINHYGDEVLKVYDVN